MKRIDSIKHLTGFFPIMIVLASYVSFIYLNYWTIPVAKDGVAFIYHAGRPDPELYIFERYFFLYFSKIIASFFDNPFTGYSFVSILYHAGIILFAYLITRKLCGKVQGILAAILISLFPFFLYHAAEFYSDTACLFFGIAAIFCSLIGDNQRKLPLRFALSGFLLAGAIFSKILGIVFIIPLIINLWSFRTFRNIFFFFMGGMGTLSFVSIGDYIWLNNFFYHINPENYLEYIAFAGSKTAVISGSSTSGSLYGFLADRLPAANIPFFAYLFFSLLLLSYTILLAIRWIAGIKDGKNIDWRHKGIISVSFAGLFTSILYFADWGTFQYQRLYSFFIPLIIVFCTRLKFLEEPGTGGKWLNKSDIASGILSMLFAIGLFMFVSNYGRIYFTPRIGNIDYLISLIVILPAITLVIFNGNSLYNNGFRKITMSLFIIGCWTIIWNAALLTNRYSFPKISENREAMAFLKKYKELSQKGEVIPVDYTGSKNDNIYLYLNILKLADEKKLALLRQKENLRNVLSSGQAPFYILTSIKHEVLDVEAESTGLFASRIEGGDYSGASFYMLDKISANLRTKSSL